MAASQDLPDLWACWLLRRLPQPARDRALPRHVGPDHSFARARRGLELVLRRRGCVRRRRDPRHDPHPAVPASAVTLSPVGTVPPRGPVPYNVGVTLRLTGTV